jgi:hypothetical protein
MESYSEYVNRLRALGIKELGSGAWAQVFQHPLYSRVVVRVFTQDDTGYKKWLKFIIRNRNNRYVPQIIPNEQGKLFYYTNIKDSYDYEDKKVPMRAYFVFIKKYAILDDKKFSDLESTLEYYLSANDIDSIQLSVRGIGYSSLLQLPQFWRALAENSQFKFEWGQDAIKIAQFFGKQNYLDINIDNVMYNIDSKHIIFTDPLGG